jgi:hypothetical protein
MTTTKTRSAHDFQSFSYGLIPTQCFVCQEFLNGPWNDPYQCQKCAINVHDHCRLQCSNQCSITHQFKPQSYLGVTTCAACGQPLWGFLNQGFKCEDCGIDVHPACRTQSSVSTCKGSLPLNNHSPTISTTTSSNNNNSSSLLPDRKDSFPRRLSIKLNEAISGNNTTTNNPMSSNSIMSPHTQTAISSYKFPSYDGDLDRIRHEIQSCHEALLEIERIENDNFEKITKPSLKSQRTQLGNLRDAVKTKLRAKNKDIAQLSEQRDEKFREFLTNFYNKFNAQKASSKNINELIKHYGNTKCKERELLRGLLDKYSKEASAVAMIEHEQSFGPLASGELERALIEAEKLASESRKLKASLDTIHRDVYFPPSKPWLFKLGAEGNFAAFTGAWLEEVVGRQALRIAVMKSDSVTPSSEDDGFRPRLMLNLSGVDTTNTSNPGTRFAARIEDLCISGTALPVSISLREAEVAVSFDLNVEAEYQPASLNSGTSAGSWRVVDKTFYIRVHKFYLKTKATGTLSIPDLVLGSLVKTFITFAFKMIVVLLLPPEMGDMMIAVHQHRVAMAKQQQQPSTPPPPPQQQQPNQSTNTENIPWRFTPDPSGNTPSTSSGGEQFLYELTDFSVKSTLSLDTVDQHYDDPDNNKSSTNNNNNHNNTARVALGLTPEQASLLIQTQKILKLTVGGLLQPNSDWLAALAQTVVGATSGSVTDTNALPLRSIIDWVRYRRDFLGFNHPGRSPKYRETSAKLCHLWQQALDVIHDLGPNASSITDANKIGGLANKMKKLVARAPGFGNSGPTSRIDFFAFVDRLSELARKEIRTEAVVHKTELCVAVRGLIRSTRDVALRVIGKKAAAAAAANSVAAVAASSSINTSSSNDKIKSTASGIASAVKGDRLNRVQEQSLGSSLSERVEKISDLVLDKLKELNERYVDSIRLRVELVANEGQFRAVGEEFRLVSPVDVGLQLPGKIFSTILSKTADGGNENHSSSTTGSGGSSTNSKWLWSRLVSVEDGNFNVKFVRVGSLTGGGTGGGESNSLIDAAFKRLGQLTNQDYKNASNMKLLSASNQQQFVISGTGLFAQMRMESGATAQDVLSLRLRPMTEPDRVEVRALGVGGMRLHLNVDRVEGAGSLAAVFQYFDDWVVFVGKYIPVAARLRFLDRWVATLAVRDSFYIDTMYWLSLKSDHSAGDLVLHSYGHADRPVVNVKLTHHLVDFFEDLQKLLEELNIVSGTGSGDGEDQAGALD